MPWLDSTGMPWLDGQPFSQGLTEVMTINDWVEQE